MKENQENESKSFVSKLTLHNMKGVDDINGSIDSLRRNIGKSPKNTGGRESSLEREGRIIIRSNSSSHKPGEKNSNKGKKADEAISEICINKSNSTSKKKHPNHSTRPGPEDKKIRNRTETKGKEERE